MKRIVGKTNKIGVSVVPNVEVAVFLAPQRTAETIENCMCRFGWWSCVSVYARKQFVVYIW